jgi:hypothetical protein
MAAVERWSRPINFTLTVPPEMTGDIASSSFANGGKVSRELALQVPAVKRGRDLICGTLGTLRFKQHGSDRRVLPSDLLDQPEEDVARSVTMTMTVEDMLLEGRAWWRILGFGPDGYPSQDPAPGGAVGLRDAHGQGVRLADRPGRGPGPGMDP